MSLPVADVSAREHPTVDREPDARARTLRGLRAILCAEAEAIAALARGDLGDAVVVLDVLQQAPGRIACSGVGKAGHVMRKVAATFSATARPACFIHPTEALHGDLGLLARGDVLLVASVSGRSAETIRLASAARSLGVTVVGITASPTGGLAEVSDYVVALVAVPEAGPDGLLPSASSAQLMALGDALALTLAVLEGRGPERIAEVHPAGTVGHRARGSQSPGFTLGR